MKDEKKDYKKILHDMMLNEWFNMKKENCSLQNSINALKEDNQSLKNKIGDLQIIIDNQNQVLNSGAFRLYDRLITPYKRIKSIRHKK